MTIWNRLRSWLRAMLHPSHTEQEMDTELRFHIDAYAEDLVRTGIPRDDAMRRARIEFGAIQRAKHQKAVNQSLFVAHRDGSRRCRGAH